MIANPATLRGLSQPGSANETSSSMTRATGIVNTMSHTPRNQIDGAMIRRRTQVGGNQSSMDQTVMPRSAR